MANKDGVITRKQVIEDEALQWGSVYEKQVQMAIDKNKEFAKGIIELNNAAKEIKGATNNSEYIKAKTKEIEISEKQGVVWKEQIQLENQLISIKKKNQLATESTSRALIKERIELQTTTKSLKLEARERLGLVSAYEKLNNRRTKAQKTLANLLSAEKVNVKQVKIAQREYDKLDARVKAVDVATKNYSKNIGNYSSAFQGLNKTARNLIQTFGLLTGVALFGQIVKDIFSTIKEFDRQLIAVGKTTNIAGEDLKVFGKKVVELGDKLNGVSVQGLLRSSEIAGQLGVKGTENILKFSTAIEKLKLTSDIISDQQVQNFAKFIEVSQDSFENADRLASVITQLGNNFATTESQVLGNATEIQKSVSIYNASAESILGLGAATSALGSQAEASRSAIQTTFKVIDKSISTGKNLEKILKLTGLTEKELSKQFNKDATGVFVKFVGGLKKAKDEGENLNNVLDSVGIVQKRTTTVIGALAANYDVLTDSVSQATIEYQNNVALNKEVEAATQSITSILGDVKDKWDAYILSTDQANGGTKKITTALKYLRDNLSGIIEKFLKYGTVLITYLGIMKLVNFTISSWTALKTAASAAELSFAVATGIGRKAVLAQAVAVKSAATAQEGLNVAMAATPWGIILAAVAAVVIAYQMFNDELSENEKRLIRIKKLKENQKAQEEEYASVRDKNRVKSFKAIEDEIALRKAKGEDLKKLDAEEIKRKKEVVTAQLNVFNNLKKAEIERTKSEIKSSEERIAQSKLELKAAIKANEEKYGRKLFKGELGYQQRRFDTSADQENLALLKASLQNNAKLTISEQKKLNKILQDLDKDKNLKDAAAYLSAQKKLRKALYELNKKENADAYKLAQFRLKNEININNEIIKNEKSSLNEKLDALDISNQKSIQKNKESLAYKLSLLGKYNEKSGRFIRQLSNTEINELIKTGTSRKKLTDEQQLLYEQYQLALTGISVNEEKKRQAIIDNEVNAIQKRIDAELQLKANNLNKDIVSENDTYKSELDSAKGNFALIEKARADHEQRILAIQKKYALEGLNIQISSIKKILSEQAKLPENERISADKIAKYTADLFKFKKEASNLETDNYTNNIITKEQAEEEFKQHVKDLSKQLKEALINLTNTIFDAKIANIDAEIQANENMYNKQLELAGNDQVQKDLITKQAEKDREKLEAKKRKEQHKQAILNKAFALADITFNTTKAVMAIASTGGGTYYADFGVMAGILTALTIALGAAQAANVIATPIPKYKQGRKSGPEELAITGDGGVREVITDKFGNNPRLTPNVPTLTFLKQDDQVHSSVDDYYKLQRAATMASIAMEGKNLNDFQAKQYFEDAYSKEMLDELKQTRKVIERQKTIILNNKIDIPHSIWESKNIDWNQ